MQGTAKLKRDKETEDEGKQKREKMKGSMYSGHKIKTQPKGLAKAWASHPTGLLLSEAVDELPNKPNPTP